MSGFGESLTQGKKLTETELGIGRAFSAPETAEDAEDIVEDTTGGIESIAAAGGTVATNGNGGGLTETNEILKDILEAVKPDAEAGREEERERELERLEDAKKGGAVTGKEGDKKGLFGDFNFGDLFKKGGIKKLITTLGGTLMSGLTTAFASTGAVGKGLLGKIGPGLAKLVGPAALLAGVAMAVTDGFKGYALSEEWGVSKFSGALGAALGGEDKGLKGAMWGGMKWALIGAGIGSIFPVVGTVIGGALGALLGAIIGYFGGEKIATAIDKMGKFFDEKWNDFLSLFGLDDKAVSAESRGKKVAEDIATLDKNILAYEKLEEKGELGEGGKERLAKMKTSRTALKGEQTERGKSTLGLTPEERDKEIAELSASEEDTTGILSMGAYGIAEAKGELINKQKAHDYQLKMHNKTLDAYRKRGTDTTHLESEFKRMYIDPIAAKKIVIEKMETRLKLLQTDAGQKK
jgi:hypothetical protein